MLNIKNFSTETIDSMVKEHLPNCVSNKAYAKSKIIKNIGITYTKPTKEDVSHIFIREFNK